MKSFRTVAVLSAAVAAAAAGILLSTAAAPRATPAERGEYLVTAMGCADCHTPWHLGPNGPEPDRSRHLSGHPAGMRIEAPAPAAGDPWMATVANTMTAWSGPWGVSFTANLTPDTKTGLGAWTEEMFVQALRTGRHMGRGRPILPPMPWPMIRNLNDDDLEAIFAYLRTIPAIENEVPQPIAGIAVTRR